MNNDVEYNVNYGALNMVKNDAFSLMAYTPNTPTTPTTPTQKMIILLYRNKRKPKKTEREPTTSV